MYVDDGNNEVVFETFFFKALTKILILWTFT
jgi:hypothetical protein